MKYLRQESNRFIFEDGGERLLADSEKSGSYTILYFKEVEVWSDLEVETHFVQYKDIQTVVQMMKILKDKGLV